MPPRVAKNTNRSSGYSRTGKHRINPLVFFQRQQVHDRLAPADVARLGQLVHLQPVNLAATGKTQQHIVRIGDEQALDEILILDLGRRLARSASSLCLVTVERLRFGITAM